MAMTAGAAPVAPVPVGAAVPSLVRWGLSTDADLVFRTLASFGPKPARALANELGLAALRTERALAELLECGAAAPGATGGRAAARVWSARPPADVVATLRSRRLHVVDPRAQARTHHGVVRALREAPSGAGLPAVTVPAAGGVLGGGVRYLATRELTRDRVGELVAAERYEQLAINTEQAWDAASARAGGQLDEEVVNRGLQLRVIGVPPADGDLLDVSGHLVNGTSYRYRETLDVPMKLLVFDRRIAIFPADPEDLERGYLEVSQPAVVQALVTLFDRQWSTAVDVGRAGVAPIVLSDRERSLITLLAAGRTDHTAAEHLRISARSVTYTMRNLMDRLGVENRFQLGLALGALRVAVPSSPTAPLQES